MEYQDYQSQRINLRGRINSVEVRNQYLAVVKVFYTFLKKADYVSHNPAADLEYAREPQRLPTAVLSEADIKKLFAQPDTRTAVGFRNRTMMELFYSTGLRRTEMLNLDLQDLDLENGLLRVRQGKGKKDRMVPIGRVASRYLETYLNGVRHHLTSDPRMQAVFISGQGKRMHAQTLAEYLRLYAQKAGLKQKVTPHVLRHTFATHMIQHEAGVRHVQEIMGHKLLTTTQAYVKLSIPDLKKAHSQFHPRETEPDE